MRPARARRVVLGPRPQRLRRALPLRSGAAWLIATVGRPDPFAWDGSHLAGNEPFPGLALHIVGHQISIPAALTIFGRLGDVAGARPPSARTVARLDLPPLRAPWGSPRPRHGSLHELAAGVESGAVDLYGLRDRDDPDAIGVPSSLRGVGPWSAQLSLIHQLHRRDVLPAGDIGIRNAIHRVYCLPELPSEPDVSARASAWAPHRSYAATRLRGCGHLPRSGSPLRPDTPGSGARDR